MNVSMHARHLVTAGADHLALWAFLDKTFGFGYATKPADARVRGANPTLGFLKFGALSLVVLGLTMAGHIWGLDRRWGTTALATKYPALR